MRKIIDLNHQWWFKPGFHADDLGNTTHEGCVEVMIPHTMKELPYNGLNPSDYQFVGMYTREISLDRLPGEVVFLCFEGVMCQADVYLNERFIGTHEGGYTPFRFDLTTELINDKPNRLVVVVNGAEIPDIPPFGGVVDYLGYSGIYREVSLLVVPEDHIKDTFIWTEDTPIYHPHEMCAHYELHTTEAIDHGQLSLRILDEDHLIHQEVIPCEAKGAHVGMMMLKEIERWDIDTPKLYTLQVQLMIQGTLVDEITLRFGCRSVHFAQNGFFINQRKVKLIGLNRHQSYPYVGYAMPKRMQERDAEILKFDLGCHIARTAHYMQSTHFLRRADEIGLLVFEEIPGWQYIGGESFKERTFANLSTMIRAHFNHPSIVLWGVRINESGDDHAFYTRTNEIARMLDPSRQTGGVRNFAHSECLEDVYTYNDFSHDGNNPGLDDPNRIAGKIKPYLVTEHNGHMFPTKRTDNEEKKMEHAFRHLRVIEDAYANDRISGAIGWCFSDYNTHSQFGSMDRICYHGVMDMFRLPKYASFAYMAQHSVEPILHIASNMTPGEYERSVLKRVVVFSNCDWLDFYHHETLIGRIYPAFSQYPHLPHPPFIIDDFIGRRIIDAHIYPPRIAKRIKKVLLSFNRFGFKMPLLDRLRMASLMILHRLTMTDAMDLYGTYVGNWGSNDPIYRFVGYRDNIAVIEKTIAQPKQIRFELTTKDLELNHHTTYDVAHLIIRALDEHDHIVPVERAFQVSLSEGLELIGPNPIPMCGGLAAFYVKTTGREASATVVILQAGSVMASLDIHIKNGA